MTIANYFTFFRILISPIFLFVYLEHDFIGINYILLPYFLLVLLSFSELSDLFDGYIARKYHQVTDLGKILDPMADSIVHISAFLAFTLDPIRLPIFLVFILFYRESIISALRTICALKGFALAARLSGKIKTVTQAIAAFAIILLMIPHSLGYISSETLHASCTWVVTIAAVYTIYSGIDYICANRNYIKRILIHDGPGISS